MRPLKTTHETLPPAVIHIILKGCLADQIDFRGLSAQDNSTPEFHLSCFQQNLSIKQGDLVICEVLLADGGTAFVPIGFVQSATKYDIETTIKVRLTYLPLRPIHGEFAVIGSCRKQ